MSRVEFLTRQLLTRQIPAQILLRPHAPAARRLHLLRIHAAHDARLLLVVERAVEALERRLHGRERNARGIDRLLHRLEPRRGRGGYGLRAARRQRLGRLPRAVAQPLERGALGVVGGDDLGDHVERPALELEPLLGAAANEPLDHGAEGTAAAAAAVVGELGIAPAPGLALELGLGLGLGRGLGTGGIAPPVVIAAPAGVGAGRQQGHDAGAGDERQRHSPRPRASLHHGRGPPWSATSTRRGRLGPGGQSEGKSDVRYEGGWRVPGAAQQTVVSPRANAPCAAPRPGHEAELISSYSPKKYIDYDLQLAYDSHIPLDEGRLRRRS